MRDVRSFDGIAVIEPLGKAIGRPVVDICLDWYFCGFSYKHAGIFVYSEIEESENYESSEKEEEEDDEEEEEDEDEDDDEVEDDGEYEGGKYLKVGIN